MFWFLVVAGALAFFAVIEDDGKNVRWLSASLLVLIIGQTSAIR